MKLQNLFLLVVCFVVFSGIAYFDYQQKLNAPTPVNPQAALIAQGVAEAQKNLPALHQQASGYPKNPPMLERTSNYKVLYSFGDSKPYYFKYYLHIPRDYRADKKYPLIVLLHGISRHMYGGYYLLDPAIESQASAFILVPIAPEGTIWGNAGAPNSSTSLAMEALRQVVAAYSIDTSRLYVSGYSMGGVGSYAMVESYPDVFAAALVLCGYWGEERAGLFPSDVPILSVHGSLDAPERSKRMVDALKAANKPASFRLYPGVGHDVWNYTYTDPTIWKAIFSLKRQKPAVIPPPAFTPQQ